jgi:hypothetical protein
VGLLDGLADGESVGGLLGGTDGLADCDLLGEKVVGETLGLEDPVMPHCCPCELPTPEVEE